MVTQLRIKIAESSMSCLSHIASVKGRKRLRAITLEPGLADIYLNFTKCDLICFSRSQVKKFRLYFRKYPENCNTNANCIRN